MNLFVTDPDCEYQHMYVINKVIYGHFLHFNLQHNITTEAPLYW